MIKCTKCGFSDNDIIILPACNHIDNGLQYVYSKSNIIKNEDDVIKNCNAIICNNINEYKAGLQSTDLVIEEDDKYHILKENGSDQWLLILIHESSSIIDDSDSVKETLMFDKVFNKVSSKQECNCTNSTSKISVLPDKLPDDMLEKLTDVLKKAYGIFSETRKCSDCIIPEPNPNDSIEVYYSKVKLCPKHDKMIKDLDKDLGL
jgi:hypothetical protein